MSLNGRLYAMPSHLAACSLAVSGAFDPYSPSEAYSGEVDIDGAVGDVQVVSVGGSLPPGAKVEVVGSKLRVTWPAYEVLASHVVDIPNKSFDDGDTGWVKGPGIVIDTSGDKLSGAYSATFMPGVGGISPIRSDTMIPVTIGKQINAQFQFQQGASSAGNMTGVTVLDWYDADRRKIGSSRGNVVDSGSGGAWHPSIARANAPADGFVCPGFDFDRRRQNRKAYLDNFTWNGAIVVADDVLGTTTTDPIPLTVLLRDGKGCMTQFDGAIVSSAVACGAATSYAGASAFPYEVKVVLGTDTGTVSLRFCPGGLPDRVEVWFDDAKVIDTGYVGDTSQQSALNAALAARGLPPATITQRTGNLGDANLDWDAGLWDTFAFTKSTDTTTATIKVYAPQGASIWKLALSCPGGF